MELNLKNGFSVLYENNSTSNYLVLRTNNDGTIINYQAQMLLNNKINGLLEFNINHIGEGLNCFYNITSKCTLDSFMSRKRFSRDEFLLTILNIINNIYQLKNYLLYDNNILLDESFIYVEPQNIEIFFVYLPFLECKNDIRSFFIKLIVKLVKFQDENSDNYIQKILEVIKDELFSLSKLKALIENLLGDEIKNQNSNNCVIDSHNIEDKQLGLKRNKVEKVIDLSVNSRFKKNEKSNSGTDKHNANKATITKGNIRIPHGNGNLTLKSKVSTLGEDKENKELNKKSKLLSLRFFILQIFIIITFILSINSNLVKLSDNPKNTIVVLSVILLSVDVLLIRLLNEKMKKTDETSSCKSLQYITNKMKKSVNTKEDELCSISKDNPVDQLPITKENYNGETVILKKVRSAEKPYLKEKDGEEVIEINKKSLLIGRMESFVDYVVNSNAIGKIHAEILEEEGNYFVMDCNSRNGTFLNDSRIISNTKNRVKNNDVLRFANKEFVFISPIEPHGVVL